MNYIGDIIPAAETKTRKSRNSSVRVNTSPLPCQRGMPCSYGGILSTMADRKESTVRCLEMNQKSCPLTLSERLTPLLISHGLVKGTTLTFGRRLSRRGIQAGVLYAPDGSVVDIQRQVSIF